MIKHIKKIQQYYKLHPLQHMAYHNGIPYGIPLQQLGMLVLCKYVTAAYFAYCRIFAYFSKVCILHFFPHKLAFLKTVLILLCFYYLFLVGFVTSTIWLPTQWHCPCVRTLWNEIG